MSLKELLRFLIIACIFATPFICLFVAESMFFPFITGKNFAFRIIVEVIFSAWLALALVAPAYRPRRSLVLGALALFVAIIGIANAQGAYPFKSFWSNYERMDGWITIAHLLAYIAVASAMVNTEDRKTASPCIQSLMSASTFPKKNSFKKPRKVLSSKPKII